MIDAKAEKNSRDDGERRRPDGGKTAAALVNFSRPERPAALRQIIATR